MSNYAILRIKKHNNVQNLMSSLKHNFREIPTDNADLEKTPRNGHFSPETKLFANNNVATSLNSTKKAMLVFNQRLKQIEANGKIRKNAVLAVEYLLTASPEWWINSTSEQRQEWRKRNIAFLIKKHGAENIFAATYQLDETTPHISAFIVPEYNGKLNARHFFGERHLLRDLQTEYAQEFADLGLIRGIENSKAKHTSVKQYYSTVNQVLKDEPFEPLNEIRQEIIKLAPIPKKDFFENHDEYSNRVYRVFGQAMQKVLTPRYARFANLHKLNADLKKKQQELEKLDKEKREFLETRQKRFDDEVQQQVAYLVEENQRLAAVAAQSERLRQKNEMLENDLKDKLLENNRLRKKIDEQDYLLRREVSLSAEKNQMLSNQEQVIVANQKLVNQLQKELKVTQIKLNDAVEQNKQKKHLNPNILDLNKDL